MNKHSIYVSFVIFVLQCHYISFLALCFGFQLTALVNQVRSLIDMHQVVCGGPFLYAFLREVGQVNSFLGCLWHF